MRQKYAVLLLLWLGMAACSLLPQPQTPEEAIGAAYLTAEGLTDATIQALEQNRITSTKAEEVLKVLEGANTTLGIARATLIQHRPQEALEYLQMATDVLTIVEEILVREGVK